jgi:hypothetical protein
MALGGSGGGGGSGAIRAGRAFVEFFAKDAGLRTFLSNLQKRLKSVSKMFATVGTGLVVGGVARLLPMIGVVNKLGDLSKMKDAATALNMTAEGASGLFGVLAAMGGDFKEDLEGITQFSGRLRDAIAGVGGPTGEAARLFEGLSVSAKDLEGVPLDEAFLRIHGAIRELPQELQASRLSLVGGTDSMKKWLPLLARSNAEIRAQSKALSSSKEDLDEAQAATLAYKEAMTQLGLVWQRVAVALAGVVEMVSKWATTVLGPLQETVRQNKALIVAFVAVSAATVALGVAFIALGAAISSVLTLFGFVSLIVSALATPFGLAAIAVAALGAGFLYLVGVGGTLRTTLAGISDALAAGDMGLAWRIGLAGMSLEWAKFVETLTLVWNDFKAFFVDAWHDAVYLVAQNLLPLSAAFGGVMRQAAVLVDGFSRVAEAIARSFAVAFAGVESVVRDSLDRILHAAEVAMGGTGNLAGAGLMAVARARLADIPTAGGALNAGIGAAREAAAGLASELNDSADALGRLGANGDAVAMELHKQFQREQKAREDARAADVRGAGVAAAEKELLDLKVAAAFRRMFGGGARGAGAGAGGVGQEVAGALNAIRGGFAGFGSLQSMFGGGGPNREVVKRLDKLVAKTDEEKDVLEEIARALGDGPRGDFVWGV